MGHRVCFIQDDDLVRWTRVYLAVGCNCLSSGCLASKVLDLFADNRDTTFVRSVQFEDSVSKVIWAEVEFRIERIICMVYWSTHPNNCLAKARIVDVFPVPGGP